MPYVEKSVIYKGMMTLEFWRAPALHYIDFWVVYKVTWKNAPTFELHSILSVRVREKSPAKY
jgi:hypothetical protein